ncbi:MULTISPECIES: hypothetical protein [unclassified Microcoleus]
MAILQQIIFLVERPSWLFPKGGIPTIVIPESSCGTAILAVAQRWQ